MDAEEKFREKMARSILQALDLDARVEFMDDLVQKNPRLRKRLKEQYDFIKRLKGESEDDFSCIVTEIGAIRYFKTLNQNEAEKALKALLKKETTTREEARQFHREIKSFPMPKLTKKVHNRFYSQRVYPDGLLEMMTDHFSKKSLFLLEDIDGDSILLSPTQNQTETALEAIFDLPPDVQVSICSRILQFYGLTA